MNVRWSVSVEQVQEKRAGRFRYVQAFSLFASFPPTLVCCDVLLQAFVINSSLLLRF